MALEDAYPVVSPESSPTRPLTNPTAISMTVRGAPSGSRVEWALGSKTGGNYRDPILGFEITPPIIGSEGSTATWVLPDIVNLRDDQVPVMQQFKMQVTHEGRTVTKDFTVYVAPRGWGEEPQPEPEPEPEPQPDGDYVYYLPLRTILGFDTGIFLSATEKASVRIQFYKQDTNGTAKEGWLVEGISVDLGANNPVTKMVRGDWQIGEADSAKVISDKPLAALSVWVSPELDYSGFPAQRVDDAS